MNGTEWAQIITAGVVFLATGVASAWTFMEDRPRLALGLLGVCLAAIVVMVFVGVSSSDRVTRECEDRGGYIESGRGITLCIDVEDGTIIRLGGDN